MGGTARAMGPGAPAGETSRRPHGAAHRSAHRRRSLLVDHARNPARRHACLRPRARRGRTLGPDHLSARPVRGRAGARASRRSSSATGRAWSRRTSSYRVGPTPPRSLKEFRGRSVVLVVMFSLPESRSRMEQLAGAYRQIEVSGAEIVAVPMSADPAIIGRLGATPPIFFPVVTEGAAEITSAYMLFSRTPESVTPRHVEFLVDRQGYMRARWIPDQRRHGMGRPRVSCERRSASWIRKARRRRRASTSTDEYCWTRWRGSGAAQGTAQRGRHRRSERPPRVGRHDWQTH